METTAQGITLPPKHCQGWVLQMFNVPQEAFCGQPGTSMMRETGPAFHTLNTPQVSTSSADTSTYASDNLQNLMTAIYSTLCTTGNPGFHVNYSHSISTPNRKRVLHVHPFQNLNVYIIPFCIHVWLFYNVLRGLCSYITTKAERGKNQDKSNRFSVLLAMTFCWQH